MGWFVVRRVFSAAALIVVVPSLSFVFFTASYTGGPVLPQLADYLRTTFLDRDLGVSSQLGQPSVGDLLREGVAVDVALLGGGFALGVLGGVLAGAAIAARPRSVLAAVLNVLGAIALAAPAYTTGIVFVLFFGSSGGEHSLFFVTDQGQYRSLTEDPLEWLHSLWVPWVAVALPVGGAVLRLTAAATRDALGEDPVRTARAKGVVEQRVLRRHALPFAVPSMSSYTGASMNIMILNIAIMEVTFNLPGSFRIAQESLTNVDFVAIQGLVLVGVFYVVMANLIADLVLARFDPRTVHS